MSVRLVIFDLDGTLVDTKVDITNALNHALKPQGVYPMTHDETVGLVGEGLTALVKKVLGAERGHLSATVIEDFLGYYTEHLVDYSRPYPGVKETLENLSGLKMAVVSNKREALSSALLNELGLLKHFERIIGSDTLGVKKPAPDAIVYLLKERSLGSEQAVIVGDSDHDIEAGKRAGVMTVAVTYGYGPRETLSEADHIINRFEDLIGIVRPEAQRDERREHERHYLPEGHQVDVQFCIHTPGGILEAELVDFSRKGIRIISEVPLIVGEDVKCEVFMPKSLSKAVRFKARVRFCSRSSVNRFTVGAEIMEIEDEIWFRVFKRIYDYIVERRGDVF